MTLEFSALSALKPYDRNARTHSKKQIKQLAASIREFGFRAPILIDDNNRIMAGHARVEAAKLLGMVSVPAIRCSGMSDAQIRGYILADNKLAENAGWDFEILTDEMQSLIDLDFNVELTGFEAPEIDLLFQQREHAAADAAADDFEPDEGKPAVTQPGDIWQIGPHRLICGDSTLGGTYAALMAGEKAQMIFTDPPYNVPVNGHVSGLGKVQHREFAMASGEMSRSEFTAFLERIFVNLTKFSQDGSIHYVCMDWRHMEEVLAAGGIQYDELKNLCVWAKTNAGMGSLYRSQHELVFIYKSGTAPHINNVELGKHGRHRSNLWTYAGANTFGKDRDQELAMHPTVKPLALVKDAILDCSKRGGIILDPFCGSGTTILAAAKTGRIGYGIELDPRYCDTILRRMLANTELTAVNTVTGRSFDEEEAKTRPVSHDD